MGAIFNDELKRLRGHFMEMGIDASEQIYQATKAFTDHDKGLAEQVLKTDPKINNEEINLEKEALKLMALQQPVASDFRKIISILKASSDIERLGDYASHIARAAINLSRREHNDEIEGQIEKMMMLVREMLERVLDAYVYTDEQKAYEVANEDLNVDLIYVQQQHAIMNALVKAGENVKAYGDYLSVIRYLERAGDHIVNLAEWIIYSGSGKLVELNPGKADPTMVKRKLQE
ncbi:MAG: phosphate signaling complex protein PhoU [Limosilactobacillus sp.]|jgi:phosphate transport system protein|uniref:phosphate signaling complex protein PhoU n=1 Tax=Limosilactobacillus sp. TaxID=2773925 RepID=UPI0025BF729B|nr:phosphate signaling complex protein PhoU [Limosilactobacillus sp.]MCI1975442.1 phosphate signaling complex protein PhoU [Limosilactobacillus sp.]MCI2030373.1 phosphate signaling complex protein PhoU [Limosilactobacillus sp.]